MKQYDTNNAARQTQPGPQTPHNTLLRAGLPLLLVTLLSCIACGGGETTSTPLTSADTTAGGETTPTQGDADNEEGLPPESNMADDSNDDPGETSSACGAASERQVRVLTELRVNGTSRQFRLSVPATNAGTKLPVLFAFQGGDGGDYPFPQQDAFNALTEAEGVIMVSPIAELLPPNEGAWQLNTRTGYTQDVDFVEAIIDDLTSRFCVDPRRIYATGYSLGSMFTYELPCHLSDRFAAIASYAGTMPLNPDSCLTDEAIGIMHIHGRDDWIISYDMTWDWKEWPSVGTMRDIPGLIAFWRDAYACGEASEENSGGVLNIVHSQCRDDARIELIALDGVEHDWPSSINGVSTHQRIWDFLSSFEKP